MKEIKAMISLRKARVHYVQVDNSESYAKTLCGTKIPTNIIYQTDLGVDCKKCLKARVR